MAEFNGFQIGIGADVTVLQAELQKAQNLLKQFEAAAKKATSIGEINYLNGQIKGLNGTISTLNQEMNKIGKPASDATQSLVNLSRIAQDAPFGFMGIANNINPMLESFQRLQKETGSAGGALKSMIAGLAGPAGLGVAVGVGTALLTTYSRELAEFFKGPTEKLKTFREELNKLNQDIYKIVGTAQANRSIGLSLVNMITGGDPTQQAEALKKLKSLYSDNKDIQDAKLGNDKAYYVHLVNMASKQEEYAGKEKNITDKLALEYDNRKKLERELDAELAKIKSPKYTLYQTGAVVETSVEEQKARIKNKYKPLFDEIDANIKTAETKGNEFVSALTGFGTPDKKGGITGTKVDFGAEAIKELNRTYAGMKAVAAKFKELGGLDNIIFGEKPEDAATKEKKRLADIKAFAAYKLDPEALLKSAPGLKGGGYITPNEEIGAGFNQIETVRKKMEAFKKTGKEVSDTINNTMIGAFTALGETIGTALTKGSFDFSAIAQILADGLMQVGQALIAYATTTGLALEAMTNPLTWPVALAAGIAAVAAGAVLKSAMHGGAKKMAEGGIVTHPTYAMVGEGGQSEAVMPLNKLGNMMNNTFNAGVMANNTNNGGAATVTLRGQDLLIALNRTQKASNLKGQSISLA